MAIERSVPAAGRHIAGLDGLRGLAALWVCLFHLGETLPWSDQPWRIFIKAGYLGVPVFFVISGLVVSQSTWTATPRQFLRSRALRILPPYFSSLLITLAVVASTRLLTGVNDLAPWPGSAYAWISMLTLTTWPLGSVKPMNWVYWSLSVEILLYALLLVSLWTVRLRHVVPLGLTVLLGLALLAMPSLQTERTLLFALAWAQFALGMALAWLRLGRRIQGTSLLALSVLMLLVCADGAQRVATAVAALLIILLAFDAPRALAATLDCAPLRALGRWSYSIYLLHVPLGVFVLARLRPASWLHDPLLHPLFDLLVSTAVVALAALHYRWVEQPCLARIRRTPTGMAATGVQP